MDTKNFYLKSFNLAVNFTEAQLNELSQVTNNKEAKKGNVVYSRGVSEKKIYMLISGKIKVTEINEQGDEMIKEVLLAGDLFGDVTTYESSNYEYAEVISERASYFIFDYTSFNNLLRSNPVLAMNYLNKVSEKFKRLESHYMNMITRDVKSRLMYCFKTWAMKEGRRSGDKVIIKNYLTHSEIANLISTSRQTVTIILNELKQTGEISYNRREIEFSNLLLAG